MPILRVGTPASANGSSNALPVSYSPVAGNFVAVWATYLGGVSNAISSVVDDGGSSYVAAFNSAGLLSNWACALFYTEVAANGVTTITVNTPTSQRIAVIVAEYSGIKAASSFDVTSARTAIGSQTTWTTGSASPVAGLEELLLGWFFTNETLNDFAASAPFLTVRNQDEAGGPRNLGATDQIVGSTTGSYSATSTISPACGGGCQFATFKGADGSVITGLRPASCL